MLNNSTVCEYGNSVVKHTMDGREEAGAQVVVKVLVLAHLKHFLPLLHRHLILHTLRALIFLTQLLPSKLHERDIQCINLLNISHYFTPRQSK